MHKHTTLSLWLCIAPFRPLTAAREREREMCSLSLFCCASLWNGIIIIAASASINCKSLIVFMLRRGRQAPGDYFYRPKLRNLSFCQWHKGFYLLAPFSSVRRQVELFRRRERLISLCAPRSPNAVNNSAASVIAWAFPFLASLPRDVRNNLYFLL